MLKNISNLDGVAVLTRGQQRSINGGIGGSCCAIVTKNNGGKFNTSTVTVTCGLTSSQAQEKATIAALAEDTRGQWCCESC